MAQRLDRSVRGGGGHCIVPGSLKRRCIIEPTNRRPDSTSIGGTKLPPFASASAPISTGPQKLPTLPSIFISANPAAHDNVSMMMMIST